MSTYDDYRTIDISIDGANDYPAQIIVSTGDTNGRRIRAKFIVDGTPVMDATGAAIYYGNDNVPADSVPMTEESDGVYTGIIPTVAYAGKACATVTVGLKKGESIVMSRSIRLIIDHAFGDDAPDNIDAGQLEDAISRAETAADDAEASATAAKTSETNAKQSANSAASSASAAGSAKTSAAASAAAAKTSENNAKTSETNAKASATAAKTSETNAKNSETNAKTAETKAAKSAQTAQTAAETVQEIADNFGVTASATDSEPGGAASVKVTKDGTSYDLAFTIPRGAQGPKGDPGDAFDAHFNQTIVGSGSSSDPYRVAPGTMITMSGLSSNTDLDTIREAGVYELIGEGYQNLPDNMTIVRGFLIVYKRDSVRFVQMAVINTNATDNNYRVVNDVYMRSFDGTVFESWEKLAKANDIPAPPVMDGTTIIGNGTSDNPYKVKEGTLVNCRQVPSDLDTITQAGAYVFAGTIVENAPYESQRGLLIYSNNKPQSSAELQVAFLSYASSAYVREIWMRYKETSTSGWMAWKKVAPANAGMTSVVTDNTTISGNGTNGNPLKLASVAADGSTILGNGTTNNKLKLASGTALTPKAVTGSGQDLNNYTSSGIYYVDTTACANTPISGQAGRLIVIKGGNNTSQLFHNTQQNRFFTRAKTNNWTPWVELTPSGKYPIFTNYSAGYLVQLSEDIGLIIVKPQTLQLSNNTATLSFTMSGYDISPVSSLGFSILILDPNGAAGMATVRPGTNSIQITANKTMSSANIFQFIVPVNFQPK